MEDVVLRPTLGMKGSPKLGLLSGIRLGKMESFNTGPKKKKMKGREAFLFTQAVLGTIQCIDSTLQHGHGLTPSCSAFSGYHSQTDTCPSSSDMVQTGAQRTEQIPSSVS